MFLIRAIKVIIIIIATIVAIYVIKLSLTIAPSEISTAPVTASV